MEDQDIQRSLSLKFHLPFKTHRNFHLYSLLKPQASSLSRVASQFSRPSSPNRGASWSSQPIRDSQSNWPSRASWSSRPSRARQSSWPIRASWPSQPSGASFKIHSRSHIGLWVSRVRWYHFQISWSRLFQMDRVRHRFGREEEMEQLW